MMIKFVFVLCIVIGVVLAEESVPESIAKAINAFNQGRFERSPMSLTDEQLETAFNNVDSNGDGNVTKAEMIQFMININIPINESVRMRLDNMFSSVMFDKNGNGTLELEEFAAVLQSLGFGMKK